MESLPCVGMEDELFGLDFIDDPELEHEMEKNGELRAALFLFRSIDNAEALEEFYSIGRKRRAVERVDRELIEALGLPFPSKAEWLGENREQFLKRALGCLRERREEWTRERPPMPMFDKSLESFSRQLGLTEPEAALLEFAVLLNGVSWLRAAFIAVHGSIGERRCIELLGRTLDINPAQAARAVARKSCLLSAGLVNWDADPMDTLPYRLRCPDELPRALLVEGAGPQEFLVKQCQPSPRSQLALDNFSYLERETRLIVQLLRAARKRGSEGVNILLYGKPGTGKTELARVLAEAAGMDAWEVGCRDEDEDAASDQARLSYLRFGQRVMANNERSLMIFDEAEDVFEHSTILFLGMHSRQARHDKAWFNQLLESNPVPIIWLSNSTWGIDSAHLRRFLYVLEVPRPPRQARRHMLERELAPLGVPKPWLEQISADERLVPGHIARARRLVEHLGELDPEEAREAAEQTLVNTLRATGQGRRLKGGEKPLTRYSPEYLNADTDLETLAEGVIRKGAGRLCFYGPPGTGKSAFARHLADRAGKPLVYRRASDLLSMWVGGTEQKIADMFEEANREGAAILLDEADSFLASRVGANQSWEVTQVNELLTQMEAFEGLFMASTNLMERLDYASLRRFDQRIHFGYLRPDQSRALLLQVLEEHGIKPGKDERSELDRIAGLSNLTPGDFAAVIRRARLSVHAAHLDWWVRAISNEGKSKPDMPATAIGFLD